MIRSFLFLFLFLLSIHTQNAHSQVIPPAPGTGTCPPADGANPQTVELCKVRKEIIVLNEQIARLEEQRDLTRSIFGRGYTFLFDPAVLGAIFGALAVAAGTILSLYFTSRQSRRQLRILFKESLVERERHNLEILNQLGKESHHERITAAATIFHRIDNEWAENNFGMDLTSRQIRTIRRAENMEEVLFVKVLLSTLRIVRANDEENQLRREKIFSQNCTDDFLNSALDSITEEKMDFELQKFIADELVLSIKARQAKSTERSVTSWKQTEPKRHQISPLKNFKGHSLDWQRTSLQKVWWKGVDARGVDFYQADMREAGLRASHFQEAQFFETNLFEARLQGSNLEKANFWSANLRGARLDHTELSGATFSGANLRGASLAEANVDESTDFRGAKFDDDTIPPKQGFDFASHGMVRE